jgi:hypothetical protein
VTDAELVYVRDVSNQRVHIRFKRAGVRGLYSLEADNADSSGAYEVLTNAEVENISEEDKCLRCFPREAE